MAPFKLRLPEDRSRGVIRVKPVYYQTLVELHNQTRLPIGNIVEQCIDYALKNMEGAPHADT